MNRLKFVVLLASLLLLRCIAIAQPAGTGTKEDPYRIVSTHDLDWFAANPELWGQEKYLIQMNDIEFPRSHVFQSIGNTEFPARLHYDGQNHSILRLTIDKNSPMVGLFGLLEHGSVKNLTIHDSFITHVAEDQNSFVGALAGYSGADISNCHVFSTYVSASGSHVGGLVGYSTGTIEQCTSALVVEGVNQVGGIVGSLVGGTIRTSRVYGAALASGLASGGIAGMMADGALISNCYVREQQVTANDYAGGIAGMLGSGNATILHCYAYEGGVGVGDNANRGLVSGDSQITQINNFYSQWTGAVEMNMGSGSHLITPSDLMSAEFLISQGWDFICESQNGNNDYWKKVITDEDGFPTFTWNGNNMESSNCKLWHGYVNSNWSEPGNWLGAVVPAAGDGVYIRGDYRSPQLDVDANVSSIIFGEENGRGDSLVLGNHNLTVARIYNARSDKYIHTNGTGKLFTNIVDGESFTFPIGIEGYAPVTITNNTDAADLFGARVNTEVYLNGYDGTVLDTVNGVKRTWYIDKNDPNQGAGVSMTFHWNTEDIYGSYLDPVLVHYNAASSEEKKWEKYTAVSVAGNSLTVAGYTGSFSPFAVLSNGLTSLPVTWGSFHVFKQQEGVLLKWTTRNEINSKLYFVQHSVDGRTWKTIGTVASNGNTGLTSFYQFLHESPVIGKNFYRLLQQDVNGHQSISKTLMLQWSAITVLQVYPNPAANGFVQVNNSKAGVLQFFNAAGALVKQVLVSAGKNTIDISSLAKGYHILVIGEGKASLIIK